MTYSKALVALLAVVVACISESSSQDTLYQATGSCQTNQVCTYKYAAEQQQFGEGQQQTIAVGAVVEVSCSSVGTYNDTSATEYCMKVQDTSLTGPMFPENKQTRDLEKYVDKLLSGWFCFVQTVEGKVATVSYASTDDLQAVNLKKSIAAAFQANFKGTEEEEEIDPQSTHISHYRYIPTNKDGAQKMHRSISSRDVEEYSTDVQPRDIQLTKDEDIEYRSGTLYSSSGTTFVEILTFSQGTQQQSADEEEPSNLTDSNTFTVNGSYTLDRMQCYTLSKSAAAQRNGRSVDNMVVTSLRATINKRSIERQQLEDLRRQLPSPSDVLMRIHQEPENTELVTKFQRLLILEAQHGPLPGTTPALTDVINYLENIDQSQDPSDVQMRQTIYSLLAQEGTLESQTALMNALVRGSDEEKEGIITHIAFTINAHMDFVEKLEGLITKETVHTDSLLLAYGALASSTSSSRVQQRIVLFLKRRLIQQMELNDTTNTVHLLHALGNTGSKRIVNLLFDYLMRGTSVEIQLAAIGAMRKLTAQESVQEAFVAILESNPQEVFIEAIAKTLFTGQEHSHVMGIHIDENPRLLNALVTSSLRFSNNTELHQLVHSYLELVNTAESRRLGKLLEHPVSHRVRRSSSSSWNASNSVYNLVSPLSSRRNDVTFYPTHKAYLWGTTFGPSKVNIQVAAGMFGGFRDRRNFKVFAKAAAKGNLFSRSATIAEASAEILYKNDAFRLKLYAEILGNLLLNRDHTTTSCCLRQTFPLYSSQYRIIGFSHSVYVYVTTISFFAELNARLDVTLQGELCINGANSDAYNPIHGSISLTPTWRVTAGGGASLTFLSATRVGITLSGTLSYKLEPVCSAHTCADTRTCGSTFQPCVELYNSWTGSNVELYAWYQLRSVKWCRGRLPWGGSFSYPCGFSWGSRRRVGALSFRWDFGGRGRSKLWGQCYSPVDSSMCAGPSTTGVGRIVPPRDFISLSSGQVNFSCPQLPPLSHSAENVSELRPQDIKVVMALGDSITAGFGIMGLHNSWGEYRGHSWSIGGDPDAQTVATFLRFYTPDIVGPSLGNKTIENILEFQYQYDDSDVLNVAVSGAKIRDLPSEITNLRYQLQELNDTGVIDMDNDWKLLTLLIGGNDLCDSCCQSSGLTADEYETHLTRALEEIRQNIPRVFVNLVPMANLSQILYRLTQQSEHCLDIRSFACLCAFVPGSAGDRFRQDLDILNAQYNQRIRKVAQDYAARGYSDFAVVVQPFLSGTTAEDLTIDFLSDLDYFHPSLIGHQHMAKSLWNSMLTPAANKTYINADEPFVCPDSSTLLYTN